jgi:hypothetical protein
LFLDLGQFGISPLGDAAEEPGLEIQFLEFHIDALSIPVRHKGLFVIELVSRRRGRTVCSDYFLPSA